MSDPHDTYGNRRDQEVPPPVRRRLLNYALGRVAKVRAAGQAQPTDSIERVLYVPAADDGYVRLSLAARGYPGRVIVSALVGAGAVQAANPADVELAGDL